MTVALPLCLSVATQRRFRKANSRLTARSSVVTDFIKYGLTTRSVKANYAIRYLLFYSTCLPTGIISSGLRVT